MKWLVFSLGGVGANLEISAVPSTQVEGERDTVVSGLNLIQRICIRPGYKRVQQFRMLLAL